jgi:hypothetical protein
MQAVPEIGRLQRRLIDPAIDNSSPALRRRVLGCEKLKPDEENDMQKITHWGETFTLRALIDHMNWLMKECMDEGNILVAREAGNGDVGLTCAALWYFTGKTPRVSPLGPSVCLVSVRKDA